MKILKFKDFDNREQFFEIIENISNPMINENLMDNKLIQKILRKLSSDIKFNIKLVGTFGTGIGFMIPIVKNLIENSKLSIDLNEENIILLCITIISISYLEETKNNTGEEINSDGEKSIVTRRDAQTMLSELKMRGIGNGIVKKFVNVFTSIKNFFKMILKGTPYIIDGLFDMFAYTSIMMPCMNAMLLFIGKYDMTLDNIAANLLSVGAAGTALISKQGINWLMSKIKDVLKIKDIQIPDKDHETIINPYQIIDSSEDGVENLIKERKPSLK